MIGVTETWPRPSDTQGLVDEVTPAGFQLHHIPGTRKDKLLSLSGFQLHHIPGTRKDKLLSLSGTTLMCALSN